MEVAPEKRPSLVCGPGLGSAAHAGEQSQLCRQRRAASHPPRRATAEELASIGFSKESLNPFLTTASFFRSSFRPFAERSSTIRCIINNSTTTG